MHKTKTHYLQKKDKKKQKKRSKMIDRLFYQIFFSSLCLLFLCYASTINLNIHNKITSHFNFLKLTSTLDTLFATNLFNQGDNYVYSSTVYDNVEFKDGINYVNNNTFSGVETLVDGIVINIQKDNGLYNIMIQASDDILYYYQGLESIDVRIYNYVNANDVIGKSPLKDNQYHFKLSIIKNGEFLNYYTNAED